MPGVADSDTHTPRRPLGRALPDEIAGWHNRLYPKADGGSALVHRIAFALLSLLAVAIATLTVSSSTAAELVATQQESTDQRARPVPVKLVPHTIKVTVSGPYDTIMRVSRADAQTEVRLRGEPFEYEFTENLVHVSSLDIAVLADSEHTSAEPLRCAITVDGMIVADDSATGPPGENGASVYCMIPRDV